MDDHDVRWKMRHFGTDKTYWIIENGNEWHKESNQVEFRRHNFFDVADERERKNETKRHVFFIFIIINIYFFYVDKLYVDIYVLYMFLDVLSLSMSVNVDL